MLGNIGLCAFLHRRGQSSFGRGKVENSSKPVGHLMTWDSPLLGVEENYICGSQQVFVGRESYFVEVQHGTGERLAD